MTTNELIDASFVARQKGDIDEAIRLMSEAMKRPDAARVMGNRNKMKPRHEGTYKKVFVV